MSVAPELRQRVDAWVVDDPDESTRRELAQLLDTAESDQEALDELTDRFAGTLEFGTAGLRGAMAAGPNRMNRAVVLRTAAGLAAYLTSRAPRTDGPGRVVIGYDARRLSAEFATDTAAVMSAAGLDACLLPRPLPTPLLAYAIGELDCVAGVMVTASHNPSADNGYKVYLGDGSQIVPPADEEIAAEIAAVSSVREIARSENWRFLDEAVVDSYVDAAAAVPDASSPRDLRLVYTPLHGVGGDTVQRVLEQAGFALPLVVPEQAEPDPDFPTVDFPNPEEPGAMDLAMALAEQHGVDLVVANDPDADRCAVAVPTPHGWRMLRGDEVGALLGDHLLARGFRGVFASTIVSSSLLSAMAHTAGVEYRETLTGFKWIGRVEGLSYGYEEALGYCVAPELVRDKDGITALLRVVELAAEEKAAGRTLLDRLDDLARDHDLYATDQLSIRVADPALIRAAVDGLRQSPPAALGGYAVESAEDLSTATGDLPPTDGMRYRLAAGGRVVVRPSGTEPKLKCYLEVVIAVEAGDVDAARIAAVGRLDAIRGDLTAALGL